MQDGSSRFSISLLRVRVFSELPGPMQDRSGIHPGWMQPLTGLYPANTPPRKLREKIGLNASRPLEPLSLLSKTPSGTPSGTNFVPLDRSVKTGCWPLAVGHWQKQKLDTHFTCRIGERACGTRHTAPVALANYVASGGYTAACAVRKRHPKQQIFRLRSHGTPGQGRGHEGHKGSSLSCCYVATTRVNRGETEPLALRLKINLSRTKNQYELLLTLLRESSA